jgi:hypothetical protein
MSGLGVVDSTTNESFEAHQGFFGFFLTQFGVISLKG